MKKVNRSVNGQHPSGKADRGLQITGLVATYGKSVAVSSLDLEIAGSEFVTLLGPSGCGKTTTLRCVAGLHTPTGGEIRLGGRRVYGDSVNVPPNKRDINMVFQSYAVWPHMTTLENVMYGLRAQKMDRAKARRKARTMLELVGLGDFEKRHATDLSGGQQQRVALARALATEPGLVLMDEPLSNLDAQLRARMRDEVRQLQKSTGTTVLYVTHDQSEALSMSDRVVVMRQGVIQQIGDPWSLYHRPANGFVANFVGEANVARGTVTEVGERTFTVSLPSLGAGTVFDVAISASEQPPGTGQAVSIVFRPEWVSVADDEQEEAVSRAGRNEVRATLLSSEFLGSHFERTYRAGEHELRVQAVTGPTSLPRQAGSEQILLITPDNLTWFVPESSAGGSSTGGGAAAEGIRESPTVTMRG
ncbi:ATP-binding cassette domain-containing protein [Actinomadura sp. LD22]|uniref:ABC-type quaternary amine transporter n=1 Tax=Actinomadura physcomitrii TaxID=2650748 RepID=A0A6I4MLC6_9ACTN|nr:ABC transporter ATP-binding protein [Actinomadura physcomitrii]MWA04777.1 ATP-binding cassette domain-containing protein [Actinomadura physcomitrii]